MSKSNDPPTVTDELAIAVKMLLYVTDPKDDHRKIVHIPVAIGMARIALAHYQQSKKERNA